MVTRPNDATRRAPGSSVHPRTRLRRLGGLTLFVAALMTATGESLEANERPGHDRFAVGDQERPELEAARRIANWLDSMVVPTIEDGLDAPDGDPDSEPLRWGIADQRPEVTLDHLYSGGSGVVLFFLELYRATGEPEYLQRAEQGGYALIESLNEPDGPISRAPGLWVGDAGLGFVLAELGLESDDESFTNAANRVVDRLVETADRTIEKAEGVARWTNVTDVIAGNAGIGSFLIYAHQHMRHPDALTLAMETANGLIDDAGVVELDNGETALKWMMSPTFEREMPNYSHGTAGVIDFLLALHQTVIAADVHGYDDRFLTAAVDGARYLESIAVTDRSTSLIAHHFPEDGELYYLGWCHGPTGTCVPLVRLTKITGDPKWSQMATKGVNALIHSGIPERVPDGFWNNVGLCCGASGVASFLMDVYQQEPNGDVERLMRALHESIIEAAESVELEGDRSGLRWTQAEHRVRPDLLESQTGIMQGAAGIGMWLLKIDAQRTDRSYRYSLPMRPHDVK